jgi:hypothetical protein
MLKLKNTVIKKFKRTVLSDREKEREVEREREKRPINGMEANFYWI